MCQTITKGIRKLSKPDRQPHIQLNQLHTVDPVKCTLNVTRNGDTVCLPISKKIAEELIAMGLSYGN